MKKWMTKTDAVLLAVLLVLAAGFLFWNYTSSKGEALTAKVTIDGETVLELPLNDLKEPKEIPLENGMLLLAEQNRICVLEADCKDGICVKTGWLERNGDVAACLPNKTVVSVHAEKTAELDGLTY